MTRIAYLAFPKTEEHLLEASAGRGMMDTFLAHTALLQHRAAVRVCVSSSYTGGKGKKAPTLSFSLSPCC